MDITASTTFDEALGEVERRIYAAALVFEELEHAGLICGNGHHIAQKMATHASGLLCMRWLKGTAAVLRQLDVEKRERSSL